jgi:hypothetical protein
MLKVYGTLLPSHSAIYCSAPLTSGKRYVEWLRGKKNFVDFDEVDAENRASHLASVLTPNIEHARQFVQHLRTRVNRPVIDPTAIPPIAGWRQQDWLGFWEQVIALYACEVVFINGWEFSYGCVHEFWFAYTTGLPVYDEDGQPLGLVDGKERIAKAVDMLQASGVSTARLEKVLKSLGDASSPHSAPG